MASDTKATITVKLKADQFMEAIRGWSIQDSGIMGFTGRASADRIRQESPLFYRSMAQSNAQVISAGGMP